MAKVNQVKQPDTKNTPTNVNDSAKRSAGISNWMAIASFIVLIILLYGRTLNYEFVLDDDLFIKNNPTMQEGLSAIPKTFAHGSQEHFKGSNFQIYRPVLVSSFLLQHQLFEFEPNGYHAFNILFYCLIAIVLFKLLRRLFPNLNTLFSAAITLLFIAHPVHTEVVANIKSQDELLAALFSLTALLCSLKYLASKEIKWQVTALICFFLALFSKESVVAFVGIFFLTFWLLREGGLLKAFKRTIPFAILALFYVLVRYAVLKDIPQGFETSAMENVLYAARTFNEEVATRLVILLKYIQLMLAPVKLSWDYSYNQIPIETFSSAAPFLSLLIIALFVFGFFYFIKKQPGISYGIAFFAILLAPVANIFFLNGTTLAERFLFTPSIGFILAIILCVLFFVKSDRENKMHTSMLVGIGAIVIIFSFLSSQQINHWVNNFSLFQSAAANAPQSTRVITGYATELMNKAQQTTDVKERDSLVQESVQYLERGLQIFPDNYQAATKLGIIYSMRGEDQRAKTYYLRSIHAHPDNVMSLNNVGSLYSKMNQNDSAIFYFKETLKLEPFNEMALRNLVITNTLVGNPEEVLRYGQQFKNYRYQDVKVDELIRQAQSLKH